MPKRVYFFGGGKAEGKAGMRNLLGGKGANLAEMASLGMPVPAGFTITTEVCTYYNKTRAKLPAELIKEVDKALASGREGHGQEVRRPGEPAAGLLPLRRPQVHARHDGDRAQHRPHHARPSPA